MQALEFSLFPGVTTKIDGSIDILRTKLENTSMIFPQLKLSNREPFFKKTFHEIFTAGRTILYFCEL